MHANFRGADGGLAFPDGIAELCTCSLMKTIFSQQKDDICSTFASLPTSTSIVMPISLTQQASSDDQTLYHLKLDLSFKGIKNRVEEHLTACKQKRTFSDTSGGGSASDTHLMTWTCALMTSVLATVKPSITLLSSMNFFQPQSCSFFEKRWSVSA